MNRALELPTHKPPSREEMLLKLLVLAIALVLLGPVVVVTAVWLSERPEAFRHRRARLIWAGLSVLGVVAFAGLWPRVWAAYSDGFDPDAGSFARQLAPWLIAWNYALLLLPLITFSTGIWRRIGEWLREPTLQEQVEAGEAWLAERETRLGQRTAGESGHPPAVPPRWLRLGPVMKDGNFRQGQGVGSVARWLAVEEWLLDQHLFVLGSTGAGKTETLKRLAAEVFEQTDRDLILVDGKGDSKLAQDFRALAWHHGRGEAPVFRLGTGESSARYDGFRGDKQDIYNRLVEMVGASTPRGQPEGDSEHYKALNRNLLQLMCYPEGEGPPRSFEEVRARLDLDWLRHAWRYDPNELAELAPYKPRDLEGLRNRLVPLVREFAPLIGPDGFALEETRAAVFSLRTQSAGDTTSRLLRFLIEDLKDFAGKRQRRPAVFIIDEFGAFGANGILSLLSLARSAQLGIVLATQDTASLGDETEQRLILANTRTKLLMATDFPEEVASLAGTILRIESSIQHDEGERTGMGSGRIQDAFRISMNEVPGLPAGEAYLIRARRAAKLHVAEIGPIPPAPPERFAPYPSLNDPPPPVEADPDPPPQPDEDNEKWELPGL